MAKPLDAYRAKRDFQTTPEPAPGEPGRREGETVFVVHRHEARRLHYDLRLEMDGVLKSWAVPRGFSYDPKDKRLAVHTEDHPLEYESFEGVIPRGEYGAGTMTIWDRGRYRLAKATAGPPAIAEGKLEFVLFGKKLRGEWHLVRTRKEKNEWLLFKARDRYARSGQEVSLAFDLAAAREAPFPEAIEPMEPGETAEPFSDPDWLFEMKFQGLRAFAAKRGEAIELRSRSLPDLAPRFPELARDLKKIRAENALIDGVLVALDEARRPSRERLGSRLEGGGAEPVYFYGFDLLYYEEWDLRSLPLVERKAVLATVLPLLPSVLYVDHVPGRGEDLVEMAGAAGLPAVVAKNASSSYAPGPSPSWREIPARPSTRAEKMDLLEALGQVAPAGPAQKIPFTNLEKIFWPKEGYTKGDLISYYDRVAEVLIPYIRERPVHLNRFPDGIEGKSFYQKDAPDHLPDWIPTELIPSESKGEPIRYIICNDRTTLLYLANLASIDLHPWLSRRGSLDSPDWAVLDLDPDESPFPQVVRVARAIGKLLRGIGLRPYLKTSGASGLHIYIPLLPGYSYEHSRIFCEGVARLVASEHKDIATVERVPGRRGGKVYIDFLQNRRGQTVVPAYTVRPVPAASVSTPLDWDELDSDLHPSQFTIQTLLPRLARLGDLFRPTLSDGQDLLPAIEAIEQAYKKK